MGITSTGLVSGLNIDSIVSQVQQSEQQPIQLLQSRQATYQKQISGLLSVSAKVSTLLAVASSVNNPENFNTHTVTVGKTPSGVSVLGASADGTAVPGSYNVTVKQLAQANKKAAQGFVDSNATSVVATDGTFSWKVGNSGTEYTVAVSAGTTLEGLRDAINSAGGSVTASIINDGTGSNPYRLILTGTKAGLDNAISITHNDTALDFTNKQVESAYAYTTNSFGGTVSSNAGNTYTGSTNKTYLVQMVSGGSPDTATYRYSTDGGITWLGYGGAAFNAAAPAGTAGAAITASSALAAIDGAGTANDGVQLGFGATGTLAVGDKFSVDAFNPELQTAQDAVVDVDGTTYVKSSNTITDLIQGVTLSLSQADASNPVTVSIGSDSSGVVEKIKNFVNAYNDVAQFLNDQLSYDPATKQGGDLLADASVRAVQTLIRNIVSGSIPGLTGGTQNLSQIGITSDSQTGLLKIDTGKLSDAVSSDPDGVKRLFLGIGTPTNSAVRFVGLTANTSPGTYGVRITVAPQKAVLGGASDPTLQDLSSTGLTNAEVLSFTYSSDYSNTSPNVTAFAVTLAAGSKINDIVTAMNSQFSTEGVGLSASNDGGKLKITSKDAGSDIRFTVVSDQAGATQTGIGTVGRTAQGVDIAGTINDHAATGKGNVLTSHSGFAEDGLQISSDTTTTGLFGRVSVSRGVGDRLSASLGAYTDPTTGIFITKSDSLQKTIDDMSKQIQTINDRITADGNRLRDQLVRLESTLGQLQATSNFLTNQLSKLPTFGTTTNK